MCKDEITLVEYKVYCGRPGYMGRGVLNCLEHVSKTKEAAMTKVAEIQHNIDAGKSNALYVFMKESTYKVPRDWAH